MAREPRGIAETRLPASDDDTLMDALEAQDERSFVEQPQRPGGDDPSVREPPVPEPESERDAERDTRHVPIGTLLDERDRRRDLEQQVARYQEMERQRALKEQAEADPLSYLSRPEEFTDSRIREILNPVLTPLYQQLAHTNRQLAVATYGAEAVDQAQREFDGAWSKGQMDRAENFRVMSQPNPFAAAVQWHRTRSMLQEVGNDPQAYRQRVADQLLSDPEFLSRAVEAARSQAQGRPITVAPRSVAGRAAQPAPRSQPRMNGLPPSLNRQGPPGGEPPLLAETDDESLYQEMIDPNKLRE